MHSNRPRYRYWAFISYARNDERWARSLHGKLERYRIPRNVRADPTSGIPAAQRLRPVFRDDDELPASGDLGDRLRDALDHSRYLIVLASTAAAGSKWVNAEVAHFVAHRKNDVLVVVLDGEPGGAPEQDSLPVALRQGAEVPLWVDARKSRQPDRKIFLRLVAGMLGTGFDALWHRDRRRRRRQCATWVATVLLLGGIVGGAVWQQQRLTEEAQPERQAAAFRQFLVADIVRTARGFNPTFSANDVDIDIVRTEDLNGGNLLDFFVFNRTAGFCGSGGCGMAVYIADGHGGYRMVLDLFGYSTPRTRNAQKSAYKEIVATYYAIDTEPIYTVYSWTGTEYGLSHYEFCDGVFVEYCEPVLVAPIDQVAHQRLTVASDAVYLRSVHSRVPLSWAVAEG